MAVDNEVATSILQGLRLEEENLVKALSRLNKVRAEYDLASSRYVAVRDLVKRRLGKSPYVSDLPGKLGILLPTDGHYRYLGMNPGEAAVEVMQEADGPLTLEEITDHLQANGLRGVGLSRSVNAAIMNRSGVKRDSEGRYFYKEDDIPFE